MIPIYSQLFCQKISIDGYILNKEKLSISNHTHHSSTLSKYYCEGEESD